jgi:hypothetical protein
MGIVACHLRFVDWARGWLAEDFRGRCRLHLIQSGNHHRFWFFRHDLKRDSGQRGKNVLRDDRVRRKDQGVEFDQAMLPPYPDPLHALTVFIRFHNFCLEQKADQR